MRAVAVLALIAIAAAAQVVDPGAVVLTPQIERHLAATPDPADLRETLTDLLARIGRPDGLDLATLTEDRTRAVEERVALNVAGVMKADRNLDGALTRLELSRVRSDWTASRFLTFFRFFDADADGRITRAEVEEGMRLRTTEVDSVALLEDLRGWDLDADGTVTPDEITRVVDAHSGGAPAR